MQVIEGKASRAGGEGSARTGGFHEAVEQQR
jgi:hypothetical protein